MSRVLIIGSNGKLAQMMTAAFTNHNVVMTTRSGVDNTIKLDLENIDDFDYSIIQPDDIILMMAAISSPQACAENYNLTYKVNTINTIRFISESIKLGSKVIFFSSDSVYEGGEGIFDEHSSCNPSNVYGKMKYEVEKQFLDCVNFKSLRLSYVIHPNDSFTSYLHHCSNTNMTAEIYRPFVRSSVSIQDLILVVKNLVKNWNILPESVLNICGPIPTEREELAEAFKKCINNDLTYKVEDAPEHFFKDRAPKIQTNSLHLKNVLGRSPYNIEESFKNLLHNN